MANHTDLFSSHWYYLKHSLHTRVHPARNDQIQLVLLFRRTQHSQSGVFVREREPHHNGAQLSLGHTQAKLVQLQNARVSHLFSKSLVVADIVRDQRGPRHLGDVLAASQRVVYAARGRSSHARSGGV